MTASYTNKNASITALLLIIRIKYLQKCSFAFA